MKGFITDLLEVMSLGAPDGATQVFSLPLGGRTHEWSYCMLVWMRFAKDAYFDSTWRGKWKECITCPSQHKLLALLDKCLEQENTKHRRWARAEFKWLDCSKPFAAAIFVTDMMVRHSLGGHPESVLLWQQAVVKSWFASGEEASAFLFRANVFFREHVVNGTSVVTQVVETQSYVAFMRMTKLSSLLLFEYLDARKLEDTAVSGAKGGSSSLLHGFRMFVSSSRRVFSLTPADVPSLGARPTVLQGLRCLARLSAQAWELLGPMKTAREYVEEEAQAVEENADIYLKATDFDPDDDESGAAATSAESGRKPNILRDDVARGLIQNYLTELSKTVGHYVDSASGEERKVDGESIPLVLHSGKSFDATLSEHDAALQRSLTCPISHQIMQDPVKCSDGKTYERAAIENWFRIRGTSPFTRETLEADDNDKSRPRLEADKEILAKIQEFKREKAEEEDRRKRDAEGEEENTILRIRYGVKNRKSSEEEQRMQDSRPEHGRDSCLDKKDGKLSKEIYFKSASQFLHCITTDSQSPTSCACLTGPPASGKTVTMFQIVHAAVGLCKSTMEDGELLVPVFMRASELSKLLSEARATNELLNLLSVPGDTGESLRHLIILFLGHYVNQKRYAPGVVEALAELFDLNLLLICIDGLDEAAAHRELVENSIDQAVRSKRSLRVLISTREHSYAHSRACFRLGEFEVVKLQPLTSERQMDMIKGRIPEQASSFKEQLDVRALQNPELATSPFLLSLMIEVYKKKGNLPARRVDLYREQVEGIVSRCFVRRVANKQEDCVNDVYKSGTNEKALKLAIEYLEVCSFVCQMLREERDFKLAACAQELQQRWSHGVELLAETRALLFEDGLVGLLSRVDDETYRFSHLTLQEYLAARCAVRLYQHDVAELVKHLEPLHSRWRREVLQFTACMLEDQVFTEFCHAVLQHEDGAGANCELVRTFLNERGDSEEVKQMLEEKFREFRGADNLVAGLCHPSPDVRELLLSEMQQFKMPPDPFAAVGLVSALQKIAEDTNSTWHKRRAGILSIVQIAQMEYCNKDEGTNRAGTLKWMIHMLNADTVVREDIHFALVKGLGTVLSTSNKGHEDQPFLILDDAIERTFLEMLNDIDSVALAEAVADLSLYSDGLVDWLLGAYGSHIITTGHWPLRHVSFICDRVAAFLVDSQLQHGGINDPVMLAAHATNLQRASRLVTVLFGRLHSPSFKTSQYLQLQEALGKVVPIIGDGWNAHTILESSRFGSAEQGARVVRMLASLNIAVEIESFDILGLDREDALPLLEALEEFKEGADRLAAWLVGKPHLESEGAWPMRNVLFICNRIPVAKNGDKALLSQLADHVMARVHSKSFGETDRADAMTALARLCAGGAIFAAVKFLGTGDPEQRIRALEVLAELKVDIRRQSLDQLSRYLLAADIKIIPAGVSEDDFKTQLCIYSNCPHGDICRYAHSKHELRQKLCKKWIHDACTLGKRCMYAHGTSESLLTQILKKEERRFKWLRNPSGNAFTHRISEYLLEVLKPLCHIDGPTKQVFERLRKSNSRDKTGKESAAGSAGRKIDVGVDELRKPDQRELELPAEAAIWTGARASGRSKNPEHPTQLSPLSNTGAEGLDTPLSKQVLDESLPYQEDLKPAPESLKTDQTSESKRLSANGVTLIIEPDIEVRSNALVAGHDAEEPLGIDGKISLLAGFPRQGQEAAIDELRAGTALRESVLAKLQLDDSDDDEPGMPQPGMPQQEPQQVEPQEGVAEEDDEEPLENVGAKLWECVDEDERQALIGWHHSGRPEDHNVGGYPESFICEVEGHWASECPILANSDNVLDELQETQNAGEPLVEERLREENGVPQELVDMKLYEHVEELETRLLQMSTPKSPDLHLPDSAPATYMSAKLLEASGLIKGFLLPNDVEREALDVDPLMYCLMEREHLNYEALCELVQHKVLGRMLFSAILHHVRAQFQMNPVSAAERLQTLADLIGRWAAARGEEQVERQLLLKELRIGRRAMELPAWSGNVSVPQGRDKGGLSCVPMCLLEEGNNKVVASVSVVKADLSKHMMLLELPEDLRRFKEYVRKLKVKSQALKALPEWLGELKNLQKLDLSDCDGLTALPKSMGRLTGLQELNLRDCKGLTALPESMGSLTGLQKLNLYKCSALTVLPESMGFLTGLQELDLRELNLSMRLLLAAESSHLSVSSRGKKEAVANVSVVKPDLSEHKTLLEVPEELRRFKEHLQELKVASQSLNALPEWLGEMRNLQKLDLSYCSGLTALPESMGRLTGLQKLDLSWCRGLTALPESMGSQTGLQDLDLSSCSRLTALPESMGRLTGLHQLTLRGCPSLTTLPVVKDMRSSGVKVLDNPFPLVKLIPELLAGNASDEDIIAEIKKTTELSVDRDVGRIVLRSVLQNSVSELGGAEKLHKYEGNALIVPEEKVALAKRKALMKKWLDKECDQAFALFEVQKYAQDMGYPKGFLSRMLATLYDLEVVEEKGVRDWLLPPDNRHSFLKQTKDAFAVKDIVEAKKQAQQFITWLDDFDDEDQGEGDRGEEEALALQAGSRRESPIQGEGDREEEEEEEEDEEAGSLRESPISRTSRRRQKLAQNWLATWTSKRSTD
jgi:Leucine-rich repeat (LRR) protein